MELSKEEMALFNMKRKDLRLEPQLTRMMIKNQLNLKNQLRAHLATKTPQ
jgi:hypothetical protein